MPELKQDKKKIASILSHLKKDYGKPVFNKDNLVNPDFMFYIVDRYLTLQKEILKICNSKHKKTSGELL